jgi:hypothetical protein
MQSGTLCVPRARPKAATPSVEDGIPTRSVGTSEGWSHSGKLFRQRSERGNEMGSSAVVFGEVCLRFPP